MHGFLQCSCIWLEQNPFIFKGITLPLDLLWDSLVYMDFSGALLIVFKMVFPSFLGKEGSFHFRYAEKWAAVLLFLLLILLFMFLFSRLS